MTFLFCSPFIFCHNAFAYLDPGTGSYILQVTLAVLFGALFMIKTFWENVKTFFRALFSKKGK
ncbi:MAG: hypothetical protein B6245_11430 [Desulfobacteraceae bacterium 4572_88]|nr:MAG: hypothetical protein B6245_11430 [Desulfobacteraceae bacterium 4572_88]